MRAFDTPGSTLGDLNADMAGRLIAAAADIALIVDGDGIICDIAFGNDELSQEGYQEWVGHPWVQAVTSESRAKVESLLRDAAAHTAPRWRHVNHRGSRGKDIPLMFSAVGVSGEGRALAVGRAVAFGRDLRPTVALQQRLVDAQQAMERDYWRYRHAEMRYRHLFQVSSEAVLVVDSSSQKIMEANPAAMELFGDSVRKLAGGGFPAGFDDAGIEAVQTLLAGVRAAGRSDQTQASLSDGRGEVTVAVSLFRQENASLFLVRLIPQARDASMPDASGHAQVLARLARQAPDCMVLTDLEGRVVTANTAFVELAQLSSEEQVQGQLLDRWLGRTGVDVSVLISNLRQRGSVRLFASSLRGEYGSATDVEVSAVMLQQGGSSFLGFMIRDVGRRLVSETRPGKDLPRSVSQLTELVGRVPLKDIVGETTDLIEQLCIEAALELTRGNRASAAEMLGLSRQSLYVKLRRFDMGDSSTSEIDGGTPRGN